MSAFWQMGGYAVFVWSAYGFCFCVCMGLLLNVYRRLRRLEREDIE